MNMNQKKIDIVVGKSMSSIAINVHNAIYITILLLLFLSQKTLANCNEISTQQMATALNARDLLPWMSIEAAECRSITLKDNNVAFSLDAQTKKIHNGIRAEVSVNYPFIEGDEITYTFDIKLPQDFKGDSPQNRWWIIAQWHDQPDPSMGESWVTFPKRSPPVSIFVEEKNGKPGIGIEVRDQNQKSWFPFPLGEWLTLKITLHWSTQQDGWVEFSVANHPEFHRHFSGKNMLNAYQHYLKMGQYRHPEIKQLNQVYFRNLNISRK